MLFYIVENLWQIILSTINLILIFLASCILEPNLNETNNNNNKESSNDIT